MTRTSSTSVWADEDWAKRVAETAGVEDDEGRARVQELLGDADIRAGRPRSAHRLQVKAVYFAGIKLWHPEERRGDDAVSRAPEDGAAPAAYTRTPFSFAHAFAPGVTIFATDGENHSGKSTVLGVVLWGLRGLPPAVTLQSDVRKKWMREAALVFDIDGQAYVTSWRVVSGRPVGGIFELTSPDDVSINALREMGLAAATAEQEAGGDVVTEDGEPDAVPGDLPTDHPDGDWSAVMSCEELVAQGRATVRARFDGDAEFGTVVGDLMMGKLEIEPVRIWRKNPGAADRSDGKVDIHGWPALSNALAIQDPTAGVVLGEEPALIQHLMGVYLGSKWAHTVVTARRYAAELNAEIASIRRRRDADSKASESDLAKLIKELDELRGKLSELDDIPSFLEVQEAARVANETAIEVSRAHTALLTAAGAYGSAERELETARRELYVLAEARATRRFFHALKPSCCPRCDAIVDEQKWSRETEGHCSLCDSEFVEQTEEVTPATVAVGEPHDEEEVLLRDLEVQVDDLETRVATLSEVHDEAARRRDDSDTAASDAAAALSTLDRAASDERYSLETQVARLEGRVAERQNLNQQATGPDLTERELAVRVYDAAKTIATAERDDEQHETLAIVSEVITDLGIRFGIRNLEKATLRANGHLPVVKGGASPMKFSLQNAGERLRLRIALTVGLLEAGRQTGAGRHPGLLIIDDLTTHEIKPDDAASMATHLASVEGLQVITASTLGPRLRDAVGPDHVVMPPEGEVVLF